MLAACCLTCWARADERFFGTWAFELPDGNPVWLGLGSAEGEVQGALLWSVGSAKPVTDLSIQGNAIQFQRKLRWKPFGNPEPVHVVTEPIEGVMKDGRLTLRVTHSIQGEEGKTELLELLGTKMPPMPDRPDLKTVRFGKPVALFNGRNLDGWRLSNPNKTNGWRAENEVLVNETPKTDFSAYGSYGNLITEDEFEDFRLTLEYNVPEKGNSGVYLRGMYEAQVVDRDSRMQGIQGPGAIFGRIEPLKNAGKAGGEWNQYVLTLVDRHITVVLNGQTVIDNAPLAGCTGGGISADDTKPGPIFLQGDHTSVKYRNLVIEPVLR